MLACLDVPTLVAALQPGETLFCEEPSRFLPGTEDHDVESGVGWLAARAVVAEGPHGDAPLAGAVVVTGDPAEVVPTDAVLQPLVRLALVLGQAVVRQKCMSADREP